MPDFEDKIPISEFSYTNSLNNTDQMPIIQQDGAAWDNFRTSLADVGLHVNKVTQYTTDLHTTNDTIIGAINELADGGASADITTSITTPASVQTFNDGGDNIPLKSLVTDIVPDQAGSGVPSPSNPRAISGHSNCIVTVSDGDSTSRTTTVSLGSTVYGGSLECVEGEGQITNGYIEFDGSSDEDWSYATGNKWATITISDMKSGANQDGITNWLPKATSYGTFGFALGRNNNNFYAYQIPDISGVTDLASWKTYLSNNPLQVVYPLATPTNLSVTGANIPTLSGVNNIYTDCGDIRSLEYFNENGDDIASLVRLMTRT